MVLAKRRLPVSPLGRQEKRHHPGTRKEPSQIGWDIRLIEEPASCALFVMARLVPTGCTHIANNRKIKRLPDGSGRSPIVMARLVRAICRGTCWWRWPVQAARAYAHLRNYMDDQHVNGEG